MNKSGALGGIIMLSKRWDSVIERETIFEGLRTDNLKCVSKKNIVCITFEMAFVHMLRLTTHMSAVQMPVGEHKL